jgi:tetratricopeptide (TPR) repeat protein
VVSVDGETCLRQAYDAIYHGDFEAAVYWFGQAIVMEPDNATYYYKGSITCARSGKLALALTYAHRSMELNPHDLTYQLNLHTLIAKQKIVDARALLSRSAPELENSLPLLRDAAKLDPLSIEARLLLGTVYRIQQDYRSALEAFREALMLDPQNEDAKRLLHEVRGERRRLLKQQYSHNHPKRNR